MLKSLKGKWRDKSASLVLAYLGALLVVSGLLMYIPLIPYWIYDRDSLDISCMAFILPGTASIIIGAIFYRHRPLHVPTIREAMIITALGWIAVGISGGIPYMLGLHKGFIDSFFESVSGFTTTGITVFEGLDSMPKSILFWRAFTQWLGGLGILSFFLAVNFRGGSLTAALFGAEGHKINIARPVPGIFHTLIILWTIYIFFTVLSLLLFLIGGMSLFDAIAHSLTCISTGGFSTHDQSIGFYSSHPGYHSILLDYVTIGIMLAGGTNFLIHYRIFTGNIKAIFKDFEMRWYWGILVTFVCLILLDHFTHASPELHNNLKEIHKAFRVILFQVSSLLTSTGYATADINSAYFPPMSKQIFIILMIIGGCVGSTAGGIKILRFAVLMRMFKTQLLRINAPAKAVIPVVVHHEVLSGNEIERISALFCTWIMLLAVGAGITAFFSDLNALQAFSGMASALGNMGPFYFSVEKMASMSWIIKITYIVGMLAGRLEIIPLAVLFTRA
jgi:trk system potassium uptake protein TrkH